jgi:hypothetical protein
MRDVIWYNFTNSSVHQTTRRHIPEYSILHSYHCENFKSLAYYCQVDKLRISLWVEYAVQEGESGYTCLTLVGELLRKISGPIHDKRMDTTKELCDLLR